MIVTRNPLSTLGRYTNKPRNHHREFYQGKGFPLAKRDPFLLRADPQVLKAIKHWAKDELRSVNGQIEFILRRALTDAGRMKTDTKDSKE